MADSALPPNSFGMGYVAGTRSPAASSAPSSVPSVGGTLNKLAAWAFALALFVGILAPVTIVMAYVAGTQIRRSGQAGAKLAKAAFIISLVYLVAGAVVVVLYIFVR